MSSQEPQFIKMLGKFKTKLNLCASGEQEQFSNPAAPQALNASPPPNSRGSVAGALCRRRTDKAHRLYSYASSSPLRHKFDA